MSEAMITEFKEINILGNKRRCIVINTYVKDRSMEFPSAYIWCKGIGFVEGPSSAGKASLIKVE